MMAYALKIHETNFPPFRVFLNFKQITIFEDINNNISRNLTHVSRLILKFSELY